MWQGCPFTLPLSFPMDCSAPMQFVFFMPLNKMLDFWKPLLLNMFDLLCLLPNMVSFYFYLLYLPFLPLKKPHYVLYHRYFHSLFSEPLNHFDFPVKGFYLALYHGLFTIYHVHVPSEFVHS